jgi:sporulation protein YlmC with PRC-barrel domain
MKMEKISVQKLNDKRIVDSEGSEMGVLHNIVADAGTGMLTDLVVRPAADLDRSKFRKEDDYIIIPFDAVKAIKDVIVVDSVKMRVRA